MTWFTSKIHSLWGSCCGEGPQAATLSYLRPLEVGPNDEVRRSAGDFMDDPETNIDFYRRSPSSSMDGMIYGSFLDDLWMVYEWFMDDLWMIYG